MKIKNSRHNWKYASLAETKQKERREKIKEKRVEDIWSNRKRIELSKKRNWLKMAICMDVNAIDFRLQYVLTASARWMRREQVFVASCFFTDFSF